ncbi:MAG: Maf family protein, partial [Bacteroidetes bacterium]|nr:Maf family protein [Bacteroidota bacterium]
ASPRRQQLLKEMGIDFEVLLRDVDESFPPDLKAEKVAVFLAEKKAHAFLSEISPEKIYITADTIVWLDDEVLGKPADGMEAYLMLKKLSGKVHQVYTGVCIFSCREKKSFVVKSDVQFRKLTNEEVTFYVEQYKPFDKAGSYGAQECLPPGMNPCSEKERTFLSFIAKENLVEKTTAGEKEHMPIIANIDGSYFNVMGLPIVELYEELKMFTGTSV